MAALLQSDIQLFSRVYMSEKNDRRQSCRLPF